MDYFFAAIEEREHPEIKNKPVVVGADPKEGKGRGVVSTSNYEARKYGIRSGMPITRAWNLCPNAVFLPVNYHLYQKVSTQIMTILQEYAGILKKSGIFVYFLFVGSLSYKKRVCPFLIFSLSLG